MLRSRLVPIALACLGVFGCVDGELPDAEVGNDSQSLTGYEGTFEFAIDAPWRMEPEVGSGANQYGPIPIAITILDMDTMSMDSGNIDELGRLISLEITPYINGVEQGSQPLLASWRNLAEIEVSRGYWMQGLGARAPQLQRCNPEQGNCPDAMRSPRGTSEWHARYWYRPPTTVVRAGNDLVMKFILTFEAGVKLENWEKVHYGEDTLPRFSDFIYGDLHYHSQGTDNEGESGYSYANVLRALGAIGIDFAFATDHASDSGQLVDSDLEYRGLNPSICARRRGLRDMNSRRFDFALRAFIGGDSGASSEVARERLRCRAPMLTRSTGCLPRVFLGGEVDIAPEIAAEDLPRTETWSEDEPSWWLHYGGGKSLFFGDENELCDGWQEKDLGPVGLNFFQCGIDMGDDSCPKTRSDWFVWNGESYFVRDAQGINDTQYLTRQHVLYLPRSARQGSFVGSRTSWFGGATRRLVGGWSGAPGEGVADEIARRGGVAFLAHPFRGGGGGLGPGRLPYTDYLLDRAFRNEAVLGLEFWNENRRFETKSPRPNKKNQFEIGYTHQSRSNFPEASRKFFALRPMCGTLLDKSPSQSDLQMPCAEMPKWQWQKRMEDPIIRLREDAAAWDRMLRWGLQEERTRSIPWLPAGEPRRVFMAGGSDAHGDFSFRRTGSLRYTTTANDDAIAKVRNLVYAPASLVNGQRFARQETVVDGLASGQFTVTDGPALRIAIDMNGNGVIDGGDAPMGAIVSTFSNPVNLLIEWKTTAEFGAMNNLTFVVGDRDESWEIAVEIPRSQWRQDSGVFTYSLSLSDFSMASMFYVRAFASTWKSECALPRDNLKEACVEHYAFTNPIWMRPSVALLSAIL